MLNLKSSILLSAAVVALLASSSLTTFAEGDAVVDNAMKAETVAKAADEKAEPAKALPKKPMTSRVGAGEVAVPHNKLRDSWIKNSEQTSSQKAAEEAREKRMAEMRGHIQTGQNKKELTVTDRKKTDADLKKSAEAAKSRSASTEMPAWKKRALAARKAREEKMASNVAPKVEVKKVEEMKPAEVKNAEPLPKMSPTEKKMIMQQEAVDKKAEPAKEEQGTETKTTIPTPPTPPKMKAPPMSQDMKDRMVKLAEEKKAEPAKEEVKKAPDTVSKDDSVAAAEKKEEARIASDIKGAQDKTAANRGDVFKELLEKRKRID